MFVMPNNSQAANFIEASVNHPEWLKIIESAQAAEVVDLARTNGFDVTLDDLKAAASNLLSSGQQGQAKTEPTEKQVDEAASGLSDFQNDTGYGDDTGYAALYGVAGVILKM